MNNMDLISRSALFKTWDALDETQDPNLLVDAMIKATQDAPSVDAEVVRCRDCVHGKVCKFNAKEPDVVICVQENMFPLRTSPDFYCAHGKKNGGEVKE